MRYVCSGCFHNAINPGAKVNNKDGDNYCYCCGNGYVEELWIDLEHANPASFKRKRKKRSSFTNLDPDTLPSIDLS